MNRENLAKTITVILSTIFFIVVGSCFSAFLYKYEMVEVENPKIFVAEGMQIFNDDGDKTIEVLELSKMSLGLKPTTGEEDPDSDIPITVSDRQGSEGLYAKCKVFAPSGAVIKIKDIHFETTQDKSIIDKERDNIYVSVREIENSTVSLKNEELILGALEPSDEKQSCTFFIWLSGKTGDDLKAVRIFFNIYFEEAE